MIYFIVLPVAAVIGAYTYRMRGGGLPPSLPRPLEQMTFCLIYLLNAWLASFLWYIALPVYAVSVVAVLKGHGRNMDLGHSHKPNSEVEREWYEFLIKGLESQLSEYWYDVIGIGLSGLTYTLVPGLCVAAFSHPVIGVLLALSGSLKAPAYMAGWGLHEWAYDNGLTERRELEDGKFYNAVKFLPREFDHNTAIGEALTGLFLWCAGAASAIYLAGNLF